VWEGFFARDL